MATVTGRIKEVTQPRGGYLPVRNFTVTDMDDCGEIVSPENISPALIGLAVDYLTRLAVEGNPQSAFEISLRGARLIGDDETALGLLARVHNDLADVSIQAACQLVGYDAAYRAGPLYYKPAQNITPDRNTSANIRTMVQRMTSFLEVNPPVMEGFDLRGGYTDLVNNGDGDFLTADGLWDIKVSRRAPTSKATLQILMYWLMGLRSIHPEFRSVTSLGIVNPRLGKTWTINTKSISNDIIEEVSKNVIGYAI